MIRALPSFTRLFKSEWNSKSRLQLRCEQYRVGVCPACWWVSRRCVYTGLIYLVYEDWTLVRDEFWIFRRWIVAFICTRCAFNGVFMLYGVPRVPDPWWRLWDTPLLLPKPSAPHHQIPHPAAYSRMFTSVDEYIRFFIDGYPYLLSLSHWRIA